MSFDGSSGADPARVREYAERFVRTVVDAGYRPKSVAQYRWVVNHLVQWIMVVHIALDRLDEAIVERFREHLSVCWCPGRRVPVRTHHSWVVGPALRFLAFLRAERAVTTAAPPPRPDPWAYPILAEFRLWMLRHRGVKEVSVERHRLPLLSLLRKLGDDPGRYTAEALRKFVTEDLLSRPVGRAKGVPDAVRMFIRWAVIMGRCPAGLERAVPTIAQWRSAALPHYLSEADVEALVAPSHFKKRAGVRDRAIILLLARLGFRAGDISHLRLDDIDWQRATLRVIGKGRRETSLPLPQDVGDALLAYLKQRPLSSSDRVFLRTVAPFGPLQDSISVSCVVARAMVRAGIRPPARYGGARALRHSLATAMLRQGASLQDVGQLLRHRSIDTTAIYAKVDIERLRQVALPWPEVPTC